MTTSIIQDIRAIHDKFKTVTSFDQNRSEYIGEQFNHQQNQKSMTRMSNIAINHQSKLAKWRSKVQQVSKKYITISEEDISKPSSCYLIKIDKLSDIPYRKHHVQKEKIEVKDDTSIQSAQLQYSKVYVQIIANLLINQKNQQPKAIICNSQTFSKRSLYLGKFEIQQNLNIFQLQQQILIYLHTKPFESNEILIQLNYTILQSMITANKIEIMSLQAFLGTSEINIAGGLKSKLKSPIKSGKQTMGTVGLVSYSVLTSDQFKLLLRLIPPNCLCSSSEIIAGLAGRRLPNRLNSFNSRIQYTELFTMKFDLLEIYIPDFLIQQKYREAQQWSQMYFPKQNSKKTKQNQQISTCIKQVVLLILFHNGWTTVNSTQIKLKQKMVIQKKDIDSSKLKKNEGVKLRQYLSEEIGILSEIFKDEEAVIILQAISKVEVKIKKQNKPEQVHLLDMPLCHSYYFPDRSTSDDRQNRIMYKGGYLDKFKRDNEKMQQLQDIQLTYSKIQFYCQLSVLNKNEQSNPDLKVSRNISGVVNKSQIDFDKIILQKQRMIKQNNKLKQQNRTRKIEINQEVIMLQNTGVNKQFYEDDFERTRKQKKDIEEILSYLEKKVQGSYQKDLSEIVKQQIKAQLKGKNDKNSDKKSLRKIHQNAFYKTALNSQVATNKEQKNIYQDTIKIPSKSNNQSVDNQEQIPLQVIKTEMLEQNYAYGILINWLSLLPIVSEQCLPRRFQLVFSFYKHCNISSISCAINQSTGEIEPYSENTQLANSKEKDKSAHKKNQKQKKSEKGQLMAKKIVYLEVGPTTYIQNDFQNFIDFISYLYHSSMQIKIIDFYSKLQFGEAYLSLKDLIRMRRNQVCLKRDLIIKKGGQIRAKLKIQIRCLKKQVASSDLPPTESSSTKIVLNQAGQSRQLQRIQNYKKQKNLVNSSVTLNKIDKILNEQFTKQEIFLYVSRMNMSIMRLQVINRKDHLMTYTLNINDEDRNFLTHQELMVMNNSTYGQLKETKQWKKLSTISPNKNSNILLVDENRCFDLQSGQRATLLLYFYSERKFYDPSKEQSNIKSYDKLVQIYCKKRCIDVTLSNAQNNQLISIYKLHIIPQPDYVTYSYEYSRKTNKKISIELSLPKYEKSILSMLNHDYMMLVDDPTAIINYNENKKKVILQVYNGDINQCRKFQVSIINPFPVSKLLVNYNILLWGSQQIIINCRLWQPLDFQMEFHNALAISRGYDYIVVFSQNQNIIVIRDKNPVKISKNQWKTNIRASITPKSFGINYYTLVVKPPLTPNSGQYSENLHRYSLKLQTPFPQIKQQITLRIKLTDKIIEEPFNFTNELPKKLKLRIASTHQHILWSSSEMIEIDPRAEKKVRIKINGQMVVQTTKIILSFINEKVITHYLFVLQLDNLF